MCLIGVRGLSITMRQARPTQRFPSRAGFRCVRYPLASGDAGIARTVQIMRGLATGNEGAANGAVRAAALQITRNVPNRDFRAEIQAIFDWVKRNIKFRGEYKEFLQSPVVTLELQAGDCDDHATLLAALLLTLGHQATFRTVATGGGKEFTHVYVTVRDKRSGQWIALDTTVAKSTLGWEPENITRQRSWRGMGDMAPVSWPAPVQATGKTAVVLEIARQFQPLINAAAQRVAGGNLYAPSAFSFQTAGASGSGIVGSGLSTSAIVIGSVGGLAILAFALRGGRG